MTEVAIYFQRLAERTGDMTEVAIYFQTENTASGNPRRGWRVVRIEGQGHGQAVTRVLWVDEGYEGLPALTAIVPDAVVGASVDTTPEAYERVREHSIEEMNEYLEIAALEARRATLGLDDDEGETW